MSDNKTWIKAYKGFDKDLKCRGRQYTDGVEDHVSDVARLCKEGVHACGHPQCYYCMNGHDLVRHEVLYGQNRAKSKALGLWILVCPDCHRWIHGEKQRWPKMDGLDVDAMMRLELKKAAQRVAMRNYSWTNEEFARRFGKNYLED